MTIFTDAKDDTTVLELKKMIEGKARLKKKKLHENITIHRLSIYCMFLCYFIDTIIFDIILRLTQSFGFFLSLLQVY